MTETTVLPEVGMGVTYSIGSDRYPYFISRVVNHRSVEIQAANYRRTDNNGFSESQTYEITPNPDAAVITITLRKDGCWYQKGQAMNSGRYWLGNARAYQDPSF